MAAIPPSAFYSEEDKVLHHFNLLRTFACVDCAGTLSLCVCSRWRRIMRDLRSVRLMMHWIWRRFDSLQWPPQPQPQPQKQNKLSCYGVLCCDAVKLDRTCGRACVCVLIVMSNSIGGFTETYIPMVWHVFILPPISTHPHNTNENNVKTNQQAHKRTHTNQPTTSRQKCQKRFSLVFPISHTHDHTAQHPHNVFTTTAVHYRNKWIERETV